METAEGTVHFVGGEKPAFGEVARFFRENFNSVLSPEDEWRFLTACDASDLNLEEILNVYDLRGAFQEGALQGGNRLNKYKKPSHPTFSVDSIYHGRPDIHAGGEYVGGQWGEKDGSTTFTPSQTMLDNTHPRAWLAGWMREHEPDVELLCPEAQS